MRKDRAWFYINVFTWILLNERMKMYVETCCFLFSFNRFHSLVDIHVYIFRFFCRFRPKIPDRSSFLVVFGYFIANIMFTGTSIRTIFLVRTNFASRLMWFCELEANFFTTIDLRSLLRFQNESHRAKMPANRRVVKFILFASSQIYPIVFLVEFSRRKHF